MSDNEETRLEKQRDFLRSLTQPDRDFIARFGIEKWREVNKS